MLHLSVDRLTSDDSIFAQIGLNRKSGEILDGWQFFLQGWLSVRTGRIARIRLQNSSVSNPEHSRQECAVNLNYAPKTDIGPYSHAVSFNHTIGLLDHLPQGVFILEVLVTPNESGEAAWHKAAIIKPEYESRRQIAQTRRQPILMTSLGRSGSTVIMNCLARHPDILVADAPPYENRHATYMASACYLTSAPGDHVKSQSPDAFEGQDRKLGTNPYNHISYIARIAEAQKLHDFYASEQTERSVSFCLNSIDGYYETIAQIQAETSKRWFAEKLLPSRQCNILLNIYSDARTLVLLRDPRDIIVSSHKMNARRGTLSFGRAPHMSDEEWILSFARGYRQLEGFYKRVKDMAALLRYEDFVLDRRGALSTMFSDLRLPAHENDLDEIEAFLDQDTYASQHATTESVKKSVGNWRTFEDKTFVDLVGAHLGPIAVEFGYES